MKKNKRNGRVRRNRKEGKCGGRKGRRVRKEGRRVRMGAGKVCGGKKKGGRGGGKSWEWMGG